MKQIPAISIKQGRVAVVESGAYTFLANSEGLYRNPVNVIKETEFPGEEIFVLDIDGLERNSPDLGTVKKMAAYRDIWLDAGAADAAGMTDLFISDASRVVMGTTCMDSLHELELALEMSGNVIFSIGYDRGIVSPDPGLAATSLSSLVSSLRAFRHLGPGLFFDLGSMKEGKPVDMSAVGTLAGLFDELYVSGNVTDRDFEVLERLGVAGVITDFRKFGVMSSG